ncbi:hypothetical protein BCR35DRAFT_300161 [Leucosporidium creatinivorum]|uniref:F-box domain-containing protein n=1 Tax=Leucosporidium creatinivorum TaxID=106004 RepID=A0A1Y2FZS3_9BASI|nr:hypothetical protein BCR35DRAFT_300161 [Leucosporidium creatinivorum]
MLEASRSRLSRWKGVAAKWSLPTALTPQPPTPPTPTSPAPAPIDYISQLPPELLEIIFQHLRAPSTPNSSDHSANAREIASLCLVSRTFLPFARALLYQDLHFKVKEDEHYASRWHEMSQEDDTAIEERYQRWSTSFADLGRTLIASPHLAQFVKSISIRVDNSGHNLLADPAARLLTSVLKACRSVERIAMKGSINGQSPALLRALVDADAQPRALSFDGDFCSRVVEAEPCADCLDGLRRFFTSRTIELQELTFVHQLPFTSIRPLLRDPPPPLQLNLTHLTINPVLQDMEFALSFFARPSAQTLQHLTLHIFHIAQPTTMPSLSLLTSLTSLTLLTPFLTHKPSEFIAALTHLISTLRAPSLTHFTLIGYTPIPPAASIDSIFLPTAALTPAFAFLPRSLKSLDCSLMPLLPGHLVAALEACERLERLEYLVPNREGKEEAGGWSEAGEEQVRSGCEERGMTRRVMRLTSREWIGISRSWRDV